MFVTAFVENTHSPGSPNTTSALLRQISSIGLCAQLQIDTHITPSATGNLGVQQTAAELHEMAMDAGCSGVRLVVLEQNDCSNHFDRALANAGAAASLQAIPTLAATAVSQCWSTAAYADGCGEGHILIMPNLTWGTPPFYATQMIYQSYLPAALKVRQSLLGGAAAQNLSVFAATVEAAGCGDVVARATRIEAASAPPLIAAEGALTAVAPTRACTTAARAA